MFGKVSGALSEHKNWTALSSEAPCRAPHYPLLTSSSGTLLHQDHRHDGDDVHVHSNHVLLFLLWNFLGMNSLLILVENGVWANTIFKKDIILFNTNSSTHPGIS